MKGPARRLAGSVRVRVTTTALLALAAALAVAVSVLEVSLQHDRQQVLMATAEEQAREVATFNPRLAAPLTLPPDANIETGLVQVVIDGQVVGASRPLRRLPPLWRRGDPEIEPTADYLADLGPDVRVVAVPVASFGVSGRVVVVTSMAQYDHTVADVGRLVGIGTPMLLAVVGIICWLTAGRALRPIETMRREVAEVAARPGSRTGHRRVPEPAGDDEVARLARTLNFMLGRISASTERERRFVSDASHELRSPLANIRTELEVALRHPEGMDWNAVASQVLAENGRMEELVSSLLLLARSDEGGFMPAAEPVDLGRVVAGLSRPGVTVQAEPVLVAVPAVYLERIVANLVDNAYRFAASTVTVTAGPEADRAVLRVSDDGPGVPEAERERIFQRFVRLDEARNRAAGGFGLGLAIVADLCRAYGGSVEVAPAGPGAEFVVRFPLVQPGGQAGAGEVGSTEADTVTGPGDSATTDVHWYGVEVVGAAEGATHAAPAVTDQNRV